MPDSKPLSAQTRAELIDTMETATNRAASAATELRERSERARRQQPSPEVTESARKFAASVAEDLGIGGGLPLILAGQGSADALGDPSVLRLPPEMLRQGGIGVVAIVAEPEDDDPDF